jgi:ATP-dependent DNA ligase
MIAMRVSCEGAAHMEKLLEFIISYEGEGLILRKKRSFYERGRSSLLVKLKA